MGEKRISPFEVGPGGRFLFELRRWDKNLKTDYYRVIVYGGVSSVGFSLRIPFHFVASCLGGNHCISTTCTRKGLV